MKIGGMASKMAQWYYGLNGQQVGPLEEGEIRNAISQGLVAPNTLVWREGMLNWLPVAQVGELAGPQSLVESPYVVPGYYDQGAMQAGRTSGLAIASMVCGIVGIVTCIFLLGIPAVICGHLALNQINNAPFATGGRGMAITGLALGYLQAVGIVAIIVVIVVAGLQSP